jgi:hypothetical protein
VIGPTPVACRGPLQDAMNRELDDKSKRLIEIQLASHARGQRFALGV